ncbi:hypothetical protein N8E86_11510 (plasmid) [Avibacterium paragallinarum]|uniref:hypothetical protein n=1 Tax=Avibacterium paragallinarum TaxID=728 RepID=UPI0021E2C10E|nr:hypothetical protein [Avibacterium paragallinarum]UXN35797.1 hypothetical protein N8E86_11510 [Avibacterium paragallinarum]
MKKNILIGAVIALLATGCVNLDRKVAIVKLQTATASMLGLASSDEITISNVEFGQNSILLGQEVTYQARTRSGRTFKCESRVLDGTILTEASIKSPSCTPLKVWK